MGLETCKGKYRMLRLFSLCPLLSLKYASYVNNKIESWEMDWDEWLSDADMSPSKTGYTWQKN